MSSEFTVVARKQKPKHEPEVMETIWAFPVDWDWDGEWPEPKTLGSFRELRRWGESKQWYHGYSPSRQLIYGMKDGKQQLFQAPANYIYSRFIAAAVWDEEGIE